MKTKIKLPGVFEAILEHDNDFPVDHGNVTYIDKFKEWKKYRRTLSKMAHDFIGQFKRPDNGV